MMRAAGAFLAVLMAAHISTESASCQAPMVLQASPAELLADVRSGASAVNVINFWATWCIPCRESFPAYQRVGREFDLPRARIIFVSTDYAENAPEARQFLAEHGVTGRTYLTSGDGARFIHAFYGEWSGALPATALLDANGTLIEFWEGGTSFEELKSRIEHVLRTTDERERTKEDNHR